MLRIEFGRTVYLLYFALWAASGNPRQHLNHFIQVSEHEMGRPVYIGPVPPELRKLYAFPESLAGISANGGYLLIRDDAPDEEVAHELIHVLMLSTHYVAVGGTRGGTLEAVIAGNLQDFVLHPRLDRIAKNRGFPQNEIASAHAERFLSYLRTHCDSKTEQQMGRLQIAGNALGLAEIIQRGAGPVSDIEKIAAINAPSALKLALLLMQRFPPNSRISPVGSFERAKQILFFLDDQVTNRWGITPSSAIELVDATKSPTISPAGEEFIRNYWNSIKTASSKDIRWRLP